MLLPLFQRFGGSMAETYLICIYKVAHPTACLNAPPSLFRRSCTDVQNHHSLTGTA